MVTATLSLPGIYTSLPTQGTYGCWLHRQGCGQCGGPQAQGPRLPSSIWRMRSPAWKKSPMPPSTGGRSSFVGTPMMGCMLLVKRSLSTSSVCSTLDGQ